MEENDFVSIWLEETGNPAIEELTNLNQQVANKATKAIAENQLTENELAIALDINPNEIKRWLTGLHSFSTKTVTEISNRLRSIDKA